MIAKFTCFEEDYQLFEQILFQQQYSEKPEVDKINLKIIDKNNCILKTIIYHIYEVDIDNTRFYTYIENCSWRSI